MGNLVVVAIPEKDDPVWKHSSEKVPHMTLLSLGDREVGPEVAQILSYIEHAANTMLYKFHMSVESRGTLGPNNADVLFFDKPSSRDSVTAFRDSLLKQGTLQEWFNDSDQFPEWTPHLTMGWPDRPAPNPDDSEGDPRRFYGVNFDRIALWTGDYDGPEVALQQYRYHDMESDMGLAHSTRSGTIDLSRKVSDLDILHVGPDDETIGNIMDDMDPEDRDIFDLIVGGAVEGEDLSDIDGLDDFYDSLSDLEKAIMSFVVGAQLSKDVSIEHSIMTDDYLEQSGVKGMRWGVRKDDGGGSSNRLSKSVSTVDRKAARATVRGGGGTLETAHVAAVKSTGHRVVNGVLGDKTHWKRAGIIAGITGVGIGAAVLAPAALPAGLLGSIAAHATGGTVVAGKLVVGGKLVTVSGSAASTVGHIPSAAIIGKGIATAVGITASTVGGSAAGVANYAGNAVRAIRGNSRINNSYAALGNAVSRRQSDGTKAVQKTLRRNGSLRKKDLRQSMDILNSLSLDQKVSDIDAVQSGVKGMHWGIRKKDSGTSVKDTASIGGTKIRVTSQAGESASSLAVRQRLAKKATKDLDASLPAFHKTYFDAHPPKDGDRMNDVEYAGYRQAYAQHAAKVVDHALAGPDPGRSVASVLLGPSTSKKEITARVAISLAALEVGRLLIHADTPAEDDPKAYFDLVAKTDDKGVAVSTTMKPVVGNIAHLMDLSRSTAAIQNTVSLDVIHNIQDYLLAHDMELVQLTASQEVAEGDALQFGRRGMRWGVRHVRGADGRVSKKVAALPDDSREAVILKAKVAKAKGTHVLSNEDLEKLNKRIALENAYSKSASDQTLLSKGHNKVKSAVDLGKTANDVAKFASSDVGLLMRAFAGDKSAANQIEAKKLAAAKQAAGKQK